MIQYDYSSVILPDPKEQYIMSSVIAGDIFYYGLFRESDNRLMSACLMNSLDKNFCKDKEIFSKLLQSSKIQNYTIKSSTFGIANPHFSILPLEQDVQDVNLLSGMFSGLNYQDDFKPNVHKLEVSELQLLYLQPSGLEEILKDHFENPSIISFNGALINGVSDLPGEFILFNFLNNRFQTVVVRNGKLLQSNEFELTGKDDALYYALLNCKQFDFEPSMSQFYYAGTLPNNSDQLKTFNKHFQNLFPLGNKNRLHYANVFLGKEKHLFFDLDCVRLCG